MAVRGGRCRSRNIPDRPAFKCKTEVVAAPRQLGTWDRYRFPARSATNCPNNSTDVILVDPRHRPRAMSTLARSCVAPGGEARADLTERTRRSAPIPATTEEGEVAYAFNAVSNLICGAEVDGGRPADRGQSPSDDCDVVADEEPREDIHARLAGVRRRKALSDRTLEIAAGGSTGSSSTYHRDFSAKPRHRPFEDHKSTDHRRASAGSMPIRRLESAGTPSTRR